MDDFRERLSRRPQLAIGRRQSAPVCCGGAPSPPSSGLSYKIGAWWRLQQWRGRRRRSFSEVLVQRSLVLGDGALSTQPRRALEGLPSRTMRGRELPLVLLALVLCQAPRGPAAPVPEARETVLAKMYPRGNHWAVGECPARTSPRRDRPVAGGRLPVSQRSWGPALGAGFALTFLSKHARSPQIRPHPSPSWTAGWALGPVPLSFLFPGCTRADAQFSKTPNPTRRRSPSLRTYPTPPFILSVNNFGKRGSPSASRSPGPAPQPRLGPA